MNFSFSIDSWFALSSGLSNRIDWSLWSKHSNHDWSLPLPKSKKIPMIQARRMSEPSRLAVEVGLELIENEDINLAIFTSRHGELERTCRILSMLNQNTAISPTDFALSVHNTAAGSLTIIAKRTIPITSLSANIDSFHQGLLEALPLIYAQDKKVLLIDFDGKIPDIYQTLIKPTIPAYAVGYILSQGNQFSCQNIEKTSTFYLAEHPQSLAFLHAYLNKKQKFTIKGNTQDWQWTQNI